MDLAAQIRNVDKEFQRFSIKFPEELWITKFCKALGSEYSELPQRKSLLISTKLIRLTIMAVTIYRVSFDNLAFQAEVDESRLKTYPAQASDMLYVPNMSTTLISVPRFSSEKDKLFF
jgi:hypothetical protein